MPQTYALNDLGHVKLSLTGVLQWAKTNEYSVLDCDRDVIIVCYAKLFYYWIKSKEMVYSLAMTYSKDLTWEKED